MKKANITNRIAQGKVMAIVRVETMERALEIANACKDGGVDCLEISFTLNNAGDIIKGLKEHFKDEMLIGAGTVLDSETARIAILAGADFIIAPNFNKDVAICANRYQIPYAPGCTSLSEAIEALEYGAAFVKAFPISDFYGSKLLSVFKTPCPYMPILASGGITLDNLEDYLNKGADCLGFGGLLTKGSYEDIKANAIKIKTIINKRA